MKKFVLTLVFALSAYNSYAEGLAYEKTLTQVRYGTMMHVGGGFGGGRFEGVGFSTQSPEHALSKCCYYGKRPIREKAVVYGYNKAFRTYGWFATIIYN